MYSQIGPKGRVPWAEPRLKFSHFVKGQLTPRDFLWKKGDPQLLSNPRVGVSLAIFMKGGPMQHIISSFVGAIQGITI